MWHSLETEWTWIFVFTVALFSLTGSAKRSNWKLHSSWSDRSPAGCVTLLLYICEVTCVHYCFRDCITIHFLSLHRVINWATKSNLCYIVYGFWCFSLLNIIRIGKYIYCEFICEGHKFIAGNLMTFIALVLLSCEYMAVQELTVSVTFCSFKYWYIELFPCRKVGKPELLVQWFWPETRGVHRYCLYRKQLSLYCHRDWEPRLIWFLVWW